MNATHDCLSTCTRHHAGGNNECNWEPVSRCLSTCECSLYNDLLRMLRAIALLSNCIELPALSPHPPASPCLPISPVTKTRPAPSQCKNDTLLFQPDMYQDDQRSTKPRTAQSPNQLAHTHTLHHARPVPTGTTSMHVLTGRARSRAWPPGAARGVVLWRRRGAPTPSWLG